RQQFRVFLVALGAAPQPLDPAFQAGEVSQHQFRLDGLDVGHRIDGAGDVDDVVVLEAAHDVGDGGDLADMGQELVAEPLALMGALHQSGDVNELDAGRHDGRDATRLVVQLPQRRQTRVGDGDHADVAVDGRERVVGG